MWNLKINCGTICGTIKQNGSEFQHITFLVFYLVLFLLGVILHSQSYILQKTPLKLDMSLQGYDQLKGCQNNRKQKDLFLLFGFISKSIFANSDSFCLIAPHICLLVVNSLFFYFLSHNSPNYNSPLTCSILRDLNIIRTNKFYHSFLNVMYSLADEHAYAFIYMYMVLLFTHCFVTRCLITHQI